MNTRPIPSSRLSGLAKYTYSKMQKAGGELFGRDSTCSDWIPFRLISTISPEKSQKPIVEDTVLNLLPST